MRWKKDRREFEIVQKFNGDTFISGQMNDEEAIEFFRDLDDCPLCQDLKAAAEKRLRAKRGH